jgi:mannose/cellobiose epimerase-like protein (N-acyl-D-glucosamine 2-epimerase family)
MPAARAKLAALHATLIRWLAHSAYPLWARAGVDAGNGGFIETIGQNGEGLPHPRRARVHPRQIYAFAQARSLGWQGDVAPIISRGMDYFETFYLRPGGLFRALAAVDGSPLDDQAALYDQAFALLGYAAAAGALGESQNGAHGRGARGAFEMRALALYGAIEKGFGGADGAFRSAEVSPDAATPGHFESNPHMHLLEACLAWAEIGADPVWASRVHGLVQLALTKFVRKDSGALGEAYATNWLPAPALAGRIIEPGHQFEWAWLLLRARDRHPAPLRDIALRLIAIGEDHGVHGQVAVNALLDDFSIHDPNARFWPQTERLKAALLAAEVTGDERYWEIAAAAAASLLPYLNTPVPGLWFDVRLPDGRFVDSPSPASTFYHLVGAVLVLQNALAA